MCNGRLVDGDDQSLLMKDLKNMNRVETFRSGRKAASPLLGQISNLEDHAVSCITHACIRHPILHIFPFFLKYQVLLAYAPDIPNEICFVNVTGRRSCSHVGNKI